MGWCGCRLRDPDGALGRVPQLMGGLVAVAAGAALMVDARLGLGPWDVLHQGLSDRTGLQIGTAAILLGFVLFLGWIPLGQRIGFGTVINVLTIGTAIICSSPSPFTLRSSAPASGHGRR